MCDGSHEHGPNPRSSWRNLTTGDMPISRRLRLAVANTWSKVRHRQQCCGHYGEPGC
jgi:hypothetical protein